MKMPTAPTTYMENLEIRSLYLGVYSILSHDLRKILALKNQTFHTYFAKAIKRQKVSLSHQLRSLTPPFVSI